MKRTIKYLLIAMAALVLASCEKEKENPILHPAGEPVQFTFTATPTSETTAALKIVADTPVPADVKITLAAGTGNNMPGLTYPSELVIAKGTTEATGTLTVDKDALTPEVKYTAAIAASLAGTTFANVTVFTITVPKPAPVTVDGDAAEWAGLPSDYVTEITCPDGAEYAGIKSAKVFYEDKLYVLLELTDDAIAKGVADGKLRAHFYFDGDNSKTDGYYHKWNKPAIDYMLEGKLSSGGQWCAISSAYHKYTGTDPNVWSGSWTSAEVSPTFTFAGKNNYYECAMDYSNYPGGLGNVIGIGFDIQDGNYAMLGYLPYGGSLAQVVKNGEEIPAVSEVEINIDGDYSEWKSVPSIAGDGAIKTMKMYETADKLYYYVEVDKNNENIKTDATLDYAHKLMLCFDNCDKKGSFGGADWAGAKYDKMYGIWLMQKGAANMSCTDLEGFEHAETDGDLMKFEFGFTKPNEAVFNGGAYLYGAYVNTQYVENATPNGEEGVHAGSAPASNHCLAYKGEPRAITLDGDFSDWVAYDGACEGNCGIFKAASDADNLYFYVHRTTGGRYSAIWNGAGYLYIAFEIDGDATTGVTLNSNGPYDYIGFFYPYGENVIIEAPGETAECLPEGTTLANIKCKGIVDETGAHIEYSIPRADLPAIPNAPIKVTSWGNKDLHKVTLTCTL